MTKFAVAECPLRGLKNICRLVLPGILAAVLSIAGCASKPPDYTPSVDSAEGAVRRGLEAWKKGLPAGELAGTPAVFVTDVGRRPHQKLDDFQILGEVRGSTGRTIAVTLTLSNPKEVQKARYLVVGIDPLWVWRQEDYELLMHWDHRMPAQPPADESEKGVSTVDRPADQRPADAELPDAAPAE